MESRRDFLNKDCITKKDIIENVFKPNNFDGIKGYKDMYELMQEDRRRSFAKKLLAFSLGGTIFSFFNIMRLTRLSPTGKIAAPFGLAFFTFLSYACV